MSLEATELPLLATGANSVGKEAKKEVDSQAQAPRAAYFDTLCPVARQQRAPLKIGVEEKTARWEVGLPDDLELILKEAAKREKDVMVCILNPPSLCPISAVLEKTLTEKRWGGPDSREDQFLYVKWYTGPKSCYAHEISRKYNLYSWPGLLLVNGETKKEMQRLCGRRAGIVKAIDNVMVPKLVEIMITLLGGKTVKEPFDMNRDVQILYHWCKVKSDGANIVLKCGARNVFCDIDEDCSGTLKDWIRDNTKLMIQLKSAARE